MKLKNIFLAGCLLVAGLSSCEMKNELLDGEKVSGETGILDLSVAVNSANNVVTKAEEGEGTEVTVPAVDPTGYELLIENSDKSYSKTHIYDPEDTGIELPVGSYTVYAHTPGEATTTNPYYGGNGAFDITAGDTKGVEVLCKMENTKFQITFSEELKNNFKSWTVTVTAVGVDNLVKGFSATSDNIVQPDAFYWMLPENVKIIRVDFTGVNNSDQTITDYREYQKPAAADKPNWTGADALAVTIGVSENTDPTGVPSITIDAEVTWDGLEDNVSVPVEGEKDPGTPTPPPTPGEGPTLSGEYLNKTVSFDAASGADNFPKVEILIADENGLGSILVKATSTNSDLEGALSIFGFTGAGVDLITTDNSTLIAVLGEMPEKGDTSYPFSVTGLIASAIMDFTGTHTFTVTTTDVNGNAGENSTGTLTFSITNSSTAGGE